MKVLTLNTWQERGPWCARWELVFEGLKTLRPDVVLLQEVFNPEWVKEIARRTGYPSTVYAEKESGLAIFSQYPLVQSGSKVLDAQSAREDYRRFVLFSQFQTPSGPLFVFNTHLSWMLEDGAVREKQTAAIAAFMEQTSGTQEALIGGDFNDTAWSRAVRLLTEEKGFVDVYRALHPKDPGLTWSYDNAYTREGRYPMPDRRIDFIFTRRGGKLLARPREARVIFTEPDAHGVFASDHSGVFTEFELNL